MEYFYTDYYNISKFNIESCLMGLTCIRVEQNPEQKKTAVKPVVFYLKSDKLRRAMEVDQ